MESLTRAGLLIPRPVSSAPEVPSYVKLDMAFGVGAGTTVFDKSRYRSHGALSGGAWVDGAHGRALDFISTEPTYVEIPATQTQLDFTSSNFSVVMRVYIDTLLDFSRLFSRGRSVVDGYIAFMDSDGKLSLRTNQSGANQDTETTKYALTTGSWLTLGFSRDGASITLLKNGVDVTNVSGTHINPATSARSFKVGVDRTLAANGLDGKMEFLRVFGGIALTTSEHLAWHNALA